MAHTGASSDVWLLPGLAANGPDADLREKLMLFGQFVGDWSIEARYPQPDGTEVKKAGALHMRWILEGRGLQDIFSSLEGNPPQEVPAGTSLRFYDPTLDTWHCAWFSPRQGSVRTFMARKVEDEIVLEGRTTEGHPERWIFSDITPKSFRWRAVTSRDGGTTWEMTEEMRMRRIPTVAPRER